MPPPGIGHPNLSVSTRVAPALAQAQAASVKRPAKPSPRKRAVQYDTDEEEDVVIVSHAMSEKPQESVPVRRASAEAARFVPAETIPLPPALRVEPVDLLGDEIVSGDIRSKNEMVEPAAHVKVHDRHATPSLGALTSHPDRNGLSKSSHATVLSSTPNRNLMDADENLTTLTKNDVVYPERGTEPGVARMPVGNGQSFFGDPLTNGDDFEVDELSE